MKKTASLLLIIFIILSSYPFCFAQEKIIDTKATICEQHFDYFLTELNELSKEYHILSDYKKESYIHVIYHSKVDTF